MKWDCGCGKCMKVLESRQSKILERPWNMGYFIAKNISQSLGEVLKKKCVVKKIVCDY